MLRYPVNGYSYWLSDRFTNSQAYNPDIVTIMLGTNDAHCNNWPELSASYYQDYIDMVTVYQNLPSNPRVILMTIPPVATSAQNCYGPGVTDINAMIPSIAAATGTEFVDIYTAIATSGYSQQELMIDGLHLTGLGQTIIAETLFNYISVALPDFAVIPGSSKSFGGPVGGPFSPSSATYALYNNSDLSLNWTASNTQSWLSVSPTSGTIAANSSVVVTVSTTASANSLSEGIYSDMITFQDTTNNITEYRNVELEARNLISVTNNSFELPGTVKIKGWDGTGSAGSATEDIPGWSSDTTATNSGVEQLSASDGSWRGFLMNTDPAVWQLTNHVLSAGETLTLRVDSIITAAATTLTMQIYYDNAGTRVTAASQDVTILSSWNEYSLSVSAGAVPAAIGKQIGILFKNATPGTTSTWLGIDNVSLSVSAGGGNGAPSFTVDPINEVSATEDAAYSSTIADNASDPESDPMTFSKVSGPAWLSVASNGTLSGTPGNSDVGVNVFTVQVAATGGSDTATLNITVINTNDAPTFTVDPINASSATAGVAYTNTIAGSATDIDAGTTLTYSKLSGPAWLSVASSGALSGTPGSGDVGSNVFTVQVSDGNGGTDTATLNITVNAAPSLPAAPSSLTATAISTSQINLSWTDNAGNETGFKIERSTRNNSSFTQIATVGANVTSYSSTGLSKNTTYYYRVRAYNADGDSAYSNEASATTPRK
jgi:hypothetical protein